jgi:hypothetical protein
MGKGTKIDIRYWASGIWIFYESTGRSTGPGTGCSVTLLARDLFQQTLSGGFFTRLFVRRGLRNMQSYTPCDTVLQLIS